MSERRGFWERIRERMVNSHREVEQQALELSMNTRLTTAQARRLIREHSLRKARLAGELMNLGWDFDRVSGIVDHWTADSIERYLRFRDAARTVPHDTGMLHQSWDPTHLPGLSWSAPTFHPACSGCANYHGRVYRGNAFVCAMHPYGPEDETCEDWEAKARPDVKIELRWMEPGISIEELQAAIETLRRNT